MLKNFRLSKGDVCTKISFIVCTYSMESFSDTVECICSILNQDYSHKEIFLVMDKNEELYKKFLISIPKTVTILVNKRPGLSEARNLGIKNANGDIIVFIDDDAIIDKNYLHNLIKNYIDENIVGVGGKILPRKKTNYPEELYWIGGFTYKGYPEHRSEVRNMLGCNMSFRKEIFDRVGLFNTDLGRIGKKLMSCEETEFGIRVLDSLPGSKIIYDPSVIVLHKVYDYRQTIMYIIKRSYSEGISKAYISDNNKKGKNMLSTESNYLKYIMFKAIPSRLSNMFVGKNVICNGRELVTLMISIASVGIGYLIGKVK